MTGIGEMTAARALRALTALVVAAVAGFAAVISYGHIYDLARQNGQDGLAAVLLPLSVDGLILAASLVLVHEAQASRGAPLLGQGMLGLGVAATLAANALYGLAWGWLGVLVSAWPAVAFVGAAEMVFLMVRRAAQPAARDTVTAPVRAPVTDATAAPDKMPAVPVAVPAPRRSPRRSPRRAGRRDTAAAVTGLRARQPELPVTDIARRLKVSERTVRRYLPAAGPVPANGHGGQPGELVAAGAPDSG